MKIPAIAGLCLALSLLAPLASAHDFTQKNVAILGDNFTKEISDGKLYFVKFFAPWCGHCKRLAPSWGVLGDSFAGEPDVVIASVDCTTAQKACNTAEIKGYPTLKLYHNGAAVEVYKGSRDLEALKSYVQEQKTKLLGKSTA